jgi:hypothetical protein
VLVKLDGLDSSWGFRAHATTGVADTERMKTEPLIRSQKRPISGYLAMSKQPHLTCANPLTMSRPDARCFTRVDAPIAVKGQAAVSHWR